MNHSSEFPLNMSREAIDTYVNGFCKRFGFDSSEKLYESTNVNDIPLMIAAMYISRGYFYVSDIEKPAMYYGTVPQIPDSCDVNTGDILFPKFMVTTKNFAEIVENDAFQALWDYAIAREFVANDNSLTFSAPSCGFGYIEPIGDESYPHKWYVNDGQMYYIDGLDGYHDPENYWHEQIFADLLNAGIQPPLIYDGDYRKVIEYNLGFAPNVDKEEVINAIMDDAVPAATSMAYRRPSADPNNFYTFQLVLNTTMQGTWTQIPVLPMTVEVK